MNESKSPSTRHRSPAWKRWLRRAGIALAALCLLGFLAYSAILLHAGKRIRREVEAIRAANEPLNWDDMIRTDREGHVLPEDRDLALSTMSQLHAEALNRAQGWEKGAGLEIYSAVRSGKRPGASDLETLGASFQDYQEPLELFRKAAKENGIAIFTERSEQDVERLSGQLSLIRGSARMLAARALYSASRGEGDEAADWCVVLCHFVRAFPGDNVLSCLVSIAVSNVACDTIRQCQEWAPSSPEKTSELMAALSELDSDTPVVRMLCGERVFGSHIFLSGMAGGGISELPKFSGRPNYAAYLEVFREAVAASRKLFPESLTVMDEIAARYAGKIGPRYTFSIFARMVVPALASSFVKAARQQAEIRVTFTSLAVRRARMDDGQFPASPEALVPEYLQELPLDPFTGNPLQYHLDDEGCLIYSVGDDGVDNGGTELTHDGRKYERGTDIVLRIPR